MQSKIDDPSTGLSGWNLVESSEQGMLVEAQKKMQKKDWVAFLAWTPHPVMGEMDLHYLTGFEADGSARKAPSWRSDAILASDGGA